ncbi:MAG: RNA-directed DNA polymerase [Cyanobacteria bacterium]|nr:RNA-directed DNA polymerase [Cyanobacteria bacterium bin.275]
MANPDGVLDPRWRKRIKEVGKNAFEIEEMVRLGFLETDDLQKYLSSNGLSFKSYQSALAELTEATAELTATSLEIESLGTVEAALAAIRSRRIARVKEERNERRARKEAERLVREEAIRRQRREEPTFLGRGVSNRLHYNGGNDDMLNQLGLPQLHSFSDIASALCLEPQQLQWLVYERGDSHVDHYIRFTIPKRSGGSRLISRPRPSLQQAQQWVQSTILHNQPLHPAAMAFRRGVSIVDNARLHSGKKIVVRLDLKDFFPSITFARVRGLFESFGYNPGVSTVLSLLCTDSPRVLLSLDNQSHVVPVGERALPQGACTSPALANLVSRSLDRRIQGYANKAGWVYTRYADDLVLSTIQETDSPHRLIRGISAVTRDEGFVVNEEKTRVMRAPNRQTVTGLLVNHDVGLTRKDLRRVRAFLHRCSSQGLEVVSAEIGKDAESVARGHLAYVQMISAASFEKLISKHAWLQH